jgi:hypothetical protein
METLLAPGWLPNIQMSVSAPVNRVDLSGRVIATWGTMFCDLQLWKLFWRPDTQLLGTSLSLQILSFIYC